jgi:hypothetical protein
MDNKDFQIEFTYQDIPYRGSVKPLEKNGEVWYAVNLESEHQERWVEIIARPSTSALEDWDFQSGDGEGAAENYDKQLLQKVGEEIEKYMIAGSDADRV